MKRMLRTVLATAAALVVSTGIASASIIALEDDQIGNVTGDALEKRLDLLASTNTKVTRIGILWDEVAPTRPMNPRDPADPAYRWDRYDAIIRGLHARGIVPIVTYYRTPKWATANGRPNAAPPPSGAGLFAGAIARRYSGDFVAADGQPLPQVRRIEVWNEPNIDFFWSPQCRRGPRNTFVPIAARRYSTLVSVASREIRAAQRDAIVIGGVAGPTGGHNDRGKRCINGTQSAAASTMVRFMRADRVRIDAWSQHLYPIGPPARAFVFPSWRALPQLFRTLDTLQPNLPVYITETGYHTSYNRFHRYYVSEAQQANWLTQTFQMAARYPRVEVTVWFNLQDNPAWTGGLYHSDLTPKPSLQRFRGLAGSRPVPPEWRR